MSARPNVPRLTENVELAAELLRRLEHLLRFVVAERQDHRIGAGVLRPRVTNCWKSVVPPGTLESPMISAP